MAFKTVDQFNKERGYDNYFSLRNDGDSAEVVILYRNSSDVLVCDAHYIKSNDYTGYVHCCGRGCPACGKGIPVRNKLFIPLYNLSTGKLEFWDRSMFFENQLNQEVFNRYPNPSEYVFRITRRGQARDVNTTYSIQATSRNTQFAYDVIMAKFNTRSPDMYDAIIREFPAGDLNLMLNAPTSGSVSTGSSYVNPDDLPPYQVTPRAAYNSSAPSVPSMGGGIDIDMTDAEEVALNGASSPAPELDGEPVF